MHDPWLPLYQKLILVLDNFNDFKNPIASLEAPFVILFLSYASDILIKMCFPSSSPDNLLITRLFFAMTETHILERII